MRLLVCLLALLSPGLAHAQVALDRTPAGEDKSRVELASELESTHKSDRLFAARELKRQAKDARRRAGRKDPLVSREAEIELLDIREDVMLHASRAVVSHDNVRKPLAVMFANLGDPEAIPALREAAAVETRPGPMRKLVWAIDTLGAP